MTLPVPSAAGVWGKCPGSVPLSAQFPDLLPSESKQEGIAGHWVAHQVATAGKPMVGTITPNGWAVDDAMVDGGVLYHGAIFSIANHRGGMSGVCFEQPLPLGFVLEGMEGRPDASLFTGPELHVWEYKYGHSEVSPVENPTMVLYALGILEKHGVNGRTDQHIKVFFHIVQPRCYTASGAFRTWSCMASDLRGMGNILRHSAEVSQKAGAPTLVGEHCHKCPGRRGCATFKRASDHDKDYAGTAVPLGITGHELATELMYCEEAFARLSARRDALAEQAEHEITTGRAVPGYEMQRGSGAEKWTVGPANVAGFGDMLGVDFRKPLAVDTPAQCRDKLKKKGIDGALIGPYIERIPGKLKLGTADYSLIQKAFKA